MEAQSPHRIVATNPLWDRECGYSAGETIGCTATIWSGPATERGLIPALLRGVEERGAFEHRHVVHYRSTGEAFGFTLCVELVRVPVAGSMEGERSAPGPDSDWSTAFLLGEMFDVVDLSASEVPWEPGSPLGGCFHPREPVSLPMGPKGCVVAMEALRQSQARVLCDERAWGRLAEGPRIITNSIDIKKRMRRPCAGLAD